MDGGSLYTAVASEAGSAIFLVENAYDRQLVIGFTAPLVMLFEVSDTDSPKLLIGFGTVKVQGETGIYFSHVEPGSSIFLAVDEHGMQEIVTLQTS